MVFEKPFLLVTAEMTLHLHNLLIQRLIRYFLKSTERISRGIEWWSMWELNLEQIGVVLP